MLNIIESLNWRYATKLFDLNTKVSEDKLENILEAIRLSPSSYGVQPWKIIVIENQELKNKLQEASYNQNQVGSAPYVLLFCATKNIEIEKYLDLIMKVRGVEIDSLSGLKNSLENVVNTKTSDEILAWNKKQVYIALGVALTTLSVLEVDSCPMEGFEVEKVNQLLGLDEMGLEATVMLPIGYRDEKDIPRKKVRYSKEEIFIKK